MTPAERQRRRRAKIQDGKPAPKRGRPVSPWLVPDEDPGPSFFDGIRRRMGVPLNEKTSLARREAVRRYRDIAYAALRDEEQFHAQFEDFLYPETLFEALGRLAICLGSHGYSRSETKGAIVDAAQFWMGRIKQGKASTAKAVKALRAERRRIERSAIDGELVLAKLTKRSSP
jgi:hypothetical protein